VHLHTVAHDLGGLPRLYLGYKQNMQTFPSPFPIGNQLVNTVETTYPAIPEAVTAVRYDLEEINPGPPLSDRWDDAKLAATELASNCVRHTSTAWFQLRVRRADDCVRIELISPGPAFSAPTELPPNAQPGGRGLWIVGVVADRWGIECGEANIVWFELLTQR
jgi:anti-sigma regulatory factor (Ser/Thr protein kinase)